ncbi:OmpH family outer membrane protein [Fluviibacterium sp. DFM31]|uniref:OmpH family outer membrane protein n=1 Tax=Meridianimarinicoccus marinus TaxID=3231483 RepID=A0ABV3L382_9RHOB
MLALALTAAFPVAAQQAAVADVPAASLPVATLDQDAIFLRSRFGIRVQQELGAERAALEAENRRIESELIAEELALTEERSLLDAATFARKADAFDARVQQIRQEQDRKALELQRKFELERQRFLSLIGPALIEVLRAAGASVLLDRDAVIFAVEGVDITERAIATIDELVGSGALAEVNPDADEGSDPNNPDTAADTSPIPDVTPAPDADAQ